MNPRRVQAGWLGIGVAWGLGGALLLPCATPDQHGALALTLGLLAGGSIIIGTVDLVAIALWLRGPGRLTGATGRHAPPDSSHMLTTLLHTMPQGYWFVDTQGKCTDVNPALGARCCARARPSSGAACSTFSRATTRRA